MPGSETLPRGSNTLLQRAARRAYAFTRDTVWNLPITRWPPAAHAAVRLGFWARRLLRLTPPGEALGLVHGHQMWFGTGSECYIEMTEGRWEPGVTRLVENVLEPDMTVVDVGAHIGYFSLLAARRVGPTGHVYAFEPAPENYELLVRNIFLNGYQHIIPVRKAVSSHQGVDTFFLHPDSVAHSLQSQTFGWSQATTEVDTTTLDLFFAAQGWPPVHLVKMDIEGAEPEALDGMVELMERNRGVRLILEFIPHILHRAGRSPRAFLTTLRGMGFRIRMITHDRGLVAFDERWSEDLKLRAELWCEPGII